LYSDKSGSGIPNMWLFLTPTPRSRDTAHAQYGFWPLGLILAEQCIW